MAETVKMNVILGYEFEVPLSRVERERVETYLAAMNTGSLRVDINFSPDGKHMFVLTQPPVDTRPIIGDVDVIAEDMVVPSILEVRRSAPVYRADRGEGWMRIYDSIHESGHTCETCRCGYEQDPDVGKGQAR